MSLTTGRSQQVTHLGHVSHLADSHLLHLLLAFLLWTHLLLTLPLLLFSEKFLLVLLSYHLDLFFLRLLLQQSGLVLFLLSSVGLGRRYPSFFHHLLSFLLLSRLFCLLIDLLRLGHLLLPRPPPGDFAGLVFRNFLKGFCYLFSTSSISTSSSPPGSSISSSTSPIPAFSPSPGSLLGI